MVLIYQTAAREISEQIDSRLFAESTILRRIIQTRAMLDFYQPIIGQVERVPSEPAMRFCLIMRESFTKGVPEEIAQQNIVIVNAPFERFCPHTLASETAQPQQALRLLITRLDDNYMLVLGYETYSQRQLLSRMLNMVYWVTGILLLASFLGSFLLSHNITTSITRISHTARSIVDGDFSKRVQTRAKDPEELQRLAHNLNHMLDRIETLIISQRQVTNNIAHDLRSPLNRLRNRMEVALIDKHTSCEVYRETIIQSVQDASNLLNTFNAIMNIAQVESRARDDFSHIDLSQICQDLAELYEVITEDGEHEFAYQIGENLRIMGNRQLIAQAITNLLDNAVKYTPSGGCVSLEAVKHDRHIVVSVSDNGVGIPADKYEEVLKRFVRLDSARSMPGNGLGLSLVSAIINLHAGMIHLKDNQPGLRIELWLPTIDQFTNQIQKQPIK